MQFIFNGTLAELMDRIRREAREQGRNIVVYHDDPDVLKIGFHRSYHNGGRFFIAKLTETENGIILDGSIGYIVGGEVLRKWQAFLDWLKAFVFFYFLMEAVLMLIWLPIFHFSHLWIPLVQPLIAEAALKINSRRFFKKLDAEFITFLSGFTAKFCPYLNEYIDEGCCYDLQKICDGYIKDSALPEIKIDKTELSKQCQNCKLR